MVKFMASIVALMPGPARGPAAVQLMKRFLILLAPARAVPEGIKTHTLRCWSRQTGGHRPPGSRPSALDELVPAGVKMGTRFLFRKGFQGSGNRVATAGQLSQRSAT